MATDPLLDAVIHGRLDAARALLDGGADPNVRHAYQRTALFFAVTGDVAMVDLLLERGADVHAKDSIGFDALHAYLVSTGPGRSLRPDGAIVRRLLEAGLDVRARNADAPHLPKACATGDVAIVELLLAAGADPNAADALSEARKARDTGAILTALVRGGIDPNRRWKDRYVDTTILVEVCKHGDLASARLLLDRGAEPSATALARAEESDHAVLVDLLLERGARPIAPSLSAEATLALDVAEREATARPEDAKARLAWANALVEHGFRAAAASEVSVLARCGVDVPIALRERLTFEEPTGVRWAFADFAPSHDGLAPRTDDARFPGARVTDGARVVPLVLTLGGACTACDDRGEVECTACGGSGTISTIFDDEPRDCDPRMRCRTCRGLKLAVASDRFGRGRCKHPSVVEEMKIGTATFLRCRSCGLAAILDVGMSTSNPDFACGVCGRFVCTCTRPRE